MKLVGQTLKSEYAMQDQYDFTSIRASSGQRLATMLLDFIFIYALSFVFGLIFLLGGMRGAIAEINDYVFGMILSLVYYVPQEAATGKTLGKRIVGTRVVSMDGHGLSFPQSVGRTFCRFIPFEAFTFLGGNGHPHGWHDSWSKTQVVVTKKLNQLSAELRSVETV